MTQTKNVQTSEFPFDQRIAWKPDPATVADARLSKFIRAHKIDDLASLQDRSTREPEWFWDAVIRDLGIRFREPYSDVLQHGHTPTPDWCVGGRMNIVDSLLDRWLESGDGSRNALVWEGEDGSTIELTYASLSESVKQCAGALRTLGLGKGDAVGLFLPMSPEILIAFLAVITIGGRILPLFSGYGSDAVATRLNDANARALVTADGFTRRGRTSPLKPTADAALAQAPGVERTIVVPHAAIDDVPMQSGRDIWWSDLMALPSGGDHTEVMDAEDILMLIYTSGTTGRPKGAVHTHCGFPIKAAQDMAHAMDVKEGEVVYWMTDMGWMMGPWLVFGSLALGATMVFYDGAPDTPDHARLWSLVERHRITHLGLSPVLIRALMPHGTEALERHDLSSIRAALSTGSPWDPDAWQWLFTNALGSAKPILNYSGGTEISGGILCGNFLGPLKPCAFSGPVPGMAADVVDDAGNPVRGAVGELVIRGPWIGMTRGFWGDEERYLDSYWRRFEGIWTHGDFAAVDDDGLWYILGRSDDTIKVAGKRLGPAEAEAVLNAHPAVVESAAIGVPDPLKGEALVVFCVLADPDTDIENLRPALQANIAKSLGKPLKPREVLFTQSLPKTRNAKIMRRLIRAIYLKRPPGDVSSLENPSTMQNIRDAR